MQVEFHFFIFHIGQHAKRQRAGQSDFLAVEIRRQVSRVGNYHFAVGAKPGRLAGGEAFASGEDSIQGRENLAGLRSECGAALP